MTDAELIKALEICTTIGESCVECPFFGDEGCNTRLKECFHNLINCQKAEIERLKDSHFEMIDRFRDALANEYLRLCNYNDFSKLNLEKIFDTLNVVYDNLVEEMAGETDV